jgi:hypothetical protein
LIPNDDEPVQTIWVGGHRGHVAHIPIQVRVAGGEAERVLRRPAASGRVEVASAAVVQPSLGIELPRREQERVGQQRLQVLV